MSTLRKLIDNMVSKAKPGVGKAPGRVSRRSKQQTRSTSFFPKFNLRNLTLKQTLLGAGGLFVGYKFIKMYQNPDSLLRVALKSKNKKVKNRPEYVLEVIRLDEKLQEYENEFVEAQQGEDAVNKKKSLDQIYNAIGLKDFSSDQLSAEQVAILVNSSRTWQKVIEKQSRILSAVRESHMQLLLDQADVACESENLKGEVDNSTGGKANSSNTDTKADTASTDTKISAALEARQQSLEKRQKDLLDALVAVCSERIAMESDFMMQVMQMMSPEFREQLRQADDVHAKAILHKVKNACLGLTPQTLHSRDSLEEGHSELDNPRVTMKTTTTSKGSNVDLQQMRSRDFWMLKMHKLAMLPQFEKPRVYVLKFNGDMMASQVERLRDEITAVLGNANKDRGDKVIVNLNSGGGTVSGYGLAAAQLARFKSAGLPLTICVDEVAASGGYMMASVADRIVASPFAILGSIGVVTSIPNISERMGREGVAMEEITAGKYKRTITPFTRTTSADRSKVKEEVESILVLFKQFILQHRPMLSDRIDKLATGETWFGPEAVRLGLADEIKTSDDEILHQMKSGAEVFTVRLKKTPHVVVSLMDVLTQEDEEGDDANSRMLARLQAAVGHWLRQAIFGSCGSWEDDAMAGIHDYKPQSWVNSGVIGVSTPNQVLSSSFTEQSETQAALKKVLAVNQSTTASLAPTGRK